MALHSNIMIQSSRQDMCYERVSNIGKNTQQGLAIFCTKLTENNFVSPVLKYRKWTNRFKALSY
jgi:hypothetical protein